MIHRLALFDDEYLVVHAVEIMLRKMESSWELVASGTDGNTALRLIEKERPQAVLIDIRMPGLDGLQVVEKVRKELPETLFVLISGYREFEYAKKGIELGVVDYIEKPITIEKLDRVFTKLELILEETRRVDEMRNIQEQRQSELQIEIEKDALIGQIREGHIEGWRNHLAILLAGLRNRKDELVFFKKQVFELIIELVGTYCEYYKAYKQDFHVPLYANVEALESFEDVEKYVTTYIEMLFQKIYVHSNGEYRRIIFRVLTYINENYQQDISLTDLADMAGLSPAYLSILFKNNVGMTFVHYLTKVRIEQAKILLGQGMKVHEVAERVGYFNYRYFTNIFKKATEMTPQEYRKKC